MSSRIVARILQNLRDKGDETAIVFGGQTISATAFLSLIEQFSTQLKAQPKNGMLAIGMDTSPEALAYFIASLDTFNHTAYFDPNWSERTTEAMLARCRVDCLVGDGAQNKPQLRAIEPADTMPLGGLSDTQPHYVCFTSGSTGLPKACIRTETSWINSFEADQEFTDITSDKTVLVLGSFAHSLFLYAAVRGLFAGAKVALLPSFSPRHVGDYLRDAANVVIFAVPTQLHVLTRHLTTPCPSVVRVLTTGSKLPAFAAQALSECFPRACIVEFYGTSELSYVAAREVSSMDEATCVGKPLSGVQVSIESNGSDHGLVYVTSELAFEGYLEEAGLRVAPDRICVGDQGFLDENGDLHLSGRVDRVFQSNGRNISPEAIELAIASINGVDHAAVFGLPDPLRENKIVAIVSAKTPITRRDIAAHLKPLVASYEIPKDYYHCEDWPKTVSGKTNLTKLSEHLNRNALEKLT